MLFFYVIAVLGGTTLLQAVEGIVEGIIVCNTGKAAEIIGRVTSEDPNTLCLFDYDGVIGAGTGHPDKTPPRFNAQGEWQPRCEHLLEIFKKLRKEKPDHTHIYSSGCLFVIESNHYLGEEHKYDPPTQGGLLFYEGLGFWVCLDSENKKNQKGSNIKHVMKFLASTGIKTERIVFIDDSISNVLSVFNACQELNTPSWCIYLPHEQIDPFYHSPTKFQTNNKWELSFLRALCVANKINYRKDCSAHNIALS